jgi:hypothetical protein
MDDADEDDDEDDGQNDEEQATGEGRRRLGLGGRPLRAPLPLASPPNAFGAADALAGVIGAGALLSPMAAHDIPLQRRSVRLTYDRGLA